MDRSQLGADVSGIMAATSKLGDAQNMRQVMLPHVPQICCELNLLAAETLAQGFPGPLYCAVTRGLHIDPLTRPQRKCLLQLVLQLHWPCCHSATFKTIHQGLACHISTTRGGRWECRHLLCERCRLCTGSSFTSLPSPFV